MRRCVAYVQPKVGKITPSLWCVTIHHTRRSVALPDPHSILTSPAGLFALMSGRGSTSYDNTSCPKGVKMSGGRRRRTEHGNGDGDGDKSSAGRGAFFNRDALSLAVLILLLAVTWEALVSQKHIFINKLKEWVFLTLEVRSSREEYAMIMDWMGQQPQGKRARNISLMPISVMEESSNENETEAMRGCSEDQCSSCGFVPGFGSHYMKFEGTRLWITRSIDTTKQYRSSPHMDREDEVLRLVFFTRDRDVARRFMEKVRLSWEERSRDTVRVYLPGGWGNRWEFLSRRLRRPLSTLHLPESTTTIVDDAKFFLSSRDLYMSLGIPWRRGYLFEGAPGTGKTSFILALASELSLPVYLLSLQSKELDDSTLIKLVNSVPPRSLLVVEDLEAAIKSQVVRGEDISSANVVFNTEVGGGRDSGVSLSALLNAIDGIASSEGRILVITTNETMRLPAPQALLRPGRIDRRVCFGPLDATIMQEMQHSFLHLVKPFCADREGSRVTLEDCGVGALGTTPAELQNQFLAAIYRKCRR
ncbi:ATP-dependent chaperone, putative [Trypanosoma brucei gambiense DAL972]|uniref:ATP-dependent chaperone, putative n=2 Tax=Trypanosoma brucei TaxID=5691 RepID=D0A462_TRYB9|nr:ATP-dependent chaperone, putative [Trypanosoma brucei gambiense DAL972]RHW68580.1 mitochondrial chaperone BCS1 [Trypanosoma brucei equiperdum]CBH16056.1 ATP-dependent chaperone, putative [Trypanosoma brucei gambiense DAL972]|eukprot:XP_011778320.1 ATP-dependent chaperone, putative [Trypanosoma brucei gambiense DAL972]